MTATPAVFFSAFIGSRPASPSIRFIRTPGVSVSERITSSPGRSTAKPKTSKPQDTLATVAGAKARIVFILSCIVANPDNVCEYSCCCHRCAGAWSAYDHGPVVITLRREENNVITARQRIKRMLFIDTAEMHLYFSIPQHGFVSQLLLS